MLRYCSALAMTAFCLFASTPAHAFNGDTVRLFGLGELGILGTMSDDQLGDLSLSPSYGGAFGFDIGLHDFFALGLMGRVLSIKLEQDIIDDLKTSAVGMATQNGSLDLNTTAQGAIFDGRSEIIDIDIYPRLRLPLPLLELYAMVPIGYSMLSPPTGASESGWNLGVSGGVGLTLIAVVQIIAQVGYSFHSFETKNTSELSFNLGLALGF